MSQAGAPARARAVRFDRSGGREVLRVDDVEVPSPAPGEVLVEVRAAGSDLAGVVTALSQGVGDVAVGDEVLGYSWTRSSHATHATVPATQLVPKPPELSWEVAGSLYVVACTAHAAVAAVNPRPGETVAVSAAAGGVGTVVVQLLASRGVRVLGIASPAHDAWLTAHGAVPVHYSEGLAERLRAAAPDGIDAFIDLLGPEYVQLAADLGVRRDRIETVIAFTKAQELGAQTKGSADASGREVLAELAGLVADGTIEVPIAAAYPLDRVADAFAELEQRHTRDKVVLVP